MTIMPKRTKVCRVCGKTYESCRSIKPGSGVFNWREMCCSPECGQIYFQRVEEARTSSSETNMEKPCWYDTVTSEESIGEDEQDCEKPTEE